MDERKWAKASSIPADGFLVDLEDSVPPALKEAARAKVVAAVRDGRLFGGRPVFARPNHPSTEWGEADLAALGDAGIRKLALPKVTSAAEVTRILAGYPGPGRPEVLAIIETAAAVADVEAIAATPGVVGLLFGAGDLCADMDIDLRRPDGTPNEVLLPLRARCAVAAAAHGLLVGESPFVADIRDTDQVRESVSSARRIGFTTMVAYYPPHIEIINEGMGTSAEQIADAELVVELYERARAGGDVAVRTDGGRVIMVMDYERARRRLAAAAASPGQPES
ncbi:aldolase/citrate lyase family protein [Streptomyces sp. NPDC051985]|uniref:HpcH/HpaI aldolase/citrate lyase family protein n=1 Tax=Streptomyces sp. NPDC051985 TaxID=3155807 RepID=UPI0034277FC7